MTPPTITMEEKPFLFHRATIHANISLVIVIVRASKFPPKKNYACLYKIR